MSDLSERPAPVSGSLLSEVRGRLPLPSPHVARAIREAAGVTQVRMAQELGVDRLTIARWESGRRQPSAQYRNAYAALLEALRGLS